MPNIKSAEKRDKQATVRELHNKSAKSRINTHRTKLLETIESGNRDLSNEQFRTYCSMLDKAVKTGVLKANTADRRKSRIAGHIAAIA